MPQHEHLHLILVLHLLLHGCTFSQQDLQALVPDILGLFVQVSLTIAPSAMARAIVSFHAPLTRALGVVIVQRPAHLAVGNRQRLPPAILSVANQHMARNRAQPPPAEGKMRQKAGACGGRLEYLEAEHLEVHLQCRQLPHETLVTSARDCIATRASLGDARVS